MTFHRLLIWTCGVFLVAAIILDLRRGDAGVIAAVFSAVALVAGYRLAEAFFRGGWS